MAGPQLRTLEPESRVMILVTASPTSMLRDHGRHPNLGVLGTPRNCYGENIQSWPWAVDNDAYLAWDEGRYRKMLERIASRRGCLFVTAPDVVGDADATLDLFATWRGELADVGHPIALVAQDGLEEPPWESFQALFIGGTTEFKMGAQAARLAREAKRRGKWLHMGRVNTRRRIIYAKGLGCDSVDGTAFSMYRKTHLPWALDYASAPTQTTMAGVA